MQNLGLNSLSDDQLVELARAIAGELTKRNPAVGDAAQSAIRDEIAKAAQSQDTLWAKKKWLAKMVTDHIGRNCELTVWRPSDSDTVRVYLDLNGGDRRGRDAIKWCLHVTGDSKHPPGTLTRDEGSRASTDANDSVVKIICQHAVAAFTRARIGCDQAAATEYDVPPMPTDYVEAIAKIAADKAAAAARKAYRDEAMAPLFGPINDAEATALAEHGKKYRFELPQVVRDDLDARSAAAHAALAEIMSAYDAEHGAKK